MKAIEAVLPLFGAALLIGCDTRPAPSCPVTGIAVATVMQTQDSSQTGLDFPGSAATTGTMRFRFPSPLAIYPATYVWRYYPRSQASYYTTFFWGNDGEFQWDDGRANTYYGAHPYPYPAPNFVPPEQVGPRYWEISVGGLDILSETTVEYDRWHSQALVVWADWMGRKHHEFYWDLPDPARVIRHTEESTYGNKYPPMPALTFGDAPWAPSKEIMDGVLRGVQIYSAALPLSDVLSELSHPLSTTSGRSCVWYLNLNPTPTDISDKSGSGHDPEWVGPERASLWRGDRARIAVGDSGPAVESGRK